MARVLIEMNRGAGWEPRQTGECEITADALAARLPAYCVQFPHRAFLDGVMVGECQPVAPQGWAPSAPGGPRPCGRAGGTSPSPA